MKSRRPDIYWFAERGVRPANRVGGSAGWTSPSGGVTLLRRWRSGGKMGAGPWVTSWRRCTRGCLLTGGLPTVRQEFGEALGRQGRQARQHLLEIGPRFEAQAMTRRGEAEQDRRGPAALVRADEQPVLAADGDALHLALGHVVVDRQEARLGISNQRRPIIQGVANRLGHRTLGQHLRALFLEPGVELVQDQERQILAHLSPAGIVELGGRGAPLQFIKLPIIGQRLMRAHDVAAACLVKLAARMRIASDLDDRRAVGARARQVQGVIAAEGVGMQVTVEVGEELLRAVALAVNGEVENVVGMAAVAPVNPRACPVHGPGS